MRGDNGEGDPERTYYLYDGDNPVVELDAQGRTTAIMTWGLLGLISRDVRGADGTYRGVLYAFDPLGNVAQRLDATTGEVLSADEYDAYGTLVTGGDPADPYGYKAQHGYYTDHETGLICCWHRYYDPAAGRWLTRDPIRHDGGVNLYEYCGGDPVQGVDAKGLDSVDGTVPLKFELGDRAGSWKGEWAVKWNLVNERYGRHVLHSTDGLFYANMETGDIYTASWTIIHGDWDLRTSSVVLRAHTRVGKLKVSKVDLGRQYGWRHGPYPFTHRNQGCMDRDPNRYPGIEPEVTAIETLLTGYYSAPDKETLQTDVKYEVYRGTHGYRLIYMDKGGEKNYNADGCLEDPRNKSTNKNITYSRYMKYEMFFQERHKFPYGDKYVYSKETRRVNILANGSIEPSLHPNAQNKWPLDTLHPMPDMLWHPDSSTDGCSTPFNL